VKPRITHRRPSRSTRDLLCVDVGNSKVLAVLDRGGRERARWRLDATAAPGLPGAWEGVLDGLETLVSIRELRAIVCSVAPRRTASLVAALRARGARAHVVTWRDPWPFALRVHTPETVGTDRLANLAGARSLGLRRAVAVDAGTAITIDLLGEHGFEGGLIAPGPALALGALHAWTEKLPLLGPPALVPVLGRDTATAVRAGVGRILGLGSAAAAATLHTGPGSPPPIVLTGGAAPTLRPHFPDSTIDEPDLLLLGLRLLARRLASGARYPS
jgi:type III pantothenate kinase